MKYALVDENTHKLITWYTPDVHKVIPESAIPVDDSVWELAISIEANFYNVDTKKFEKKDFRTPKQLEDYRIDSIKAKAGEIILAKYSIIKQLNTNADGGDKQVEMNNWIKKIRDISNKAEKDKTALANINWEI